MFDNEPPDSLTGIAAALQFEIGAHASAEACMEAMERRDALLRAAARMPIRTMADLAHILLLLETELDHDGVAPPMVARELLSAALLYVRQAVEKTSPEPVLRA